MLYLTISEQTKRQGFVVIISPLKAGVKATAEEEEAAIPVVEGTIPIYTGLLNRQPLSTLAEQQIGSCKTDTPRRTKAEGHQDDAGQPRGETNLGTVDDINQLPAASPTIAHPAHPRSKSSLNLS
ncbi:MAG: hypothetical protein Q9181_002541 [Wetmoreana brouardii]